MFGYKNKWCLKDDVICLSDYGSFSSQRRLFLPTKNTIVPQVNSAIGAPKAVKLVAYSHATLFLPALSTLEKVLQCGYVCNFPGLTVKTLQCHLPCSIATAKGHLDQV
jgi:hypothetical protein